MVENVVAKPERLAFIDWMKCMGMLLIVYGHSRAGTELINLKPIYEKQLGVVFFIFVCGYSLAQEIRPAPKAVAIRLFNIYLFGFIFALAMSVIGLLTTGNLEESNYMPLVLGVNVFVNWFPANPTTWYIGTYLHLLLLWAVLLKRIKVTWSITIVVILISIVVRAAIISSQNGYIAYMLLTNWLSVFLLGLMQGGIGSGTGQAEKKRVADWVGVPLLAFALLVVWPQLTQALEFENTVPIANLCWNHQPSAWATSVCVELIYFSAAWLFYRVTLCLPRVKIVEFFARNTLIIFILHMPIVHAVSPYVGLVQYGWLRVTINILLYFVLLGFVSEFLQQLLQPKKIMKIVFAWFEKRFATFS